MEGHHTAPQMQQFYDLKLFGDYIYKYNNSQIKDPYLKNIRNLFAKETTTAELLRMHKEIDDLKKEFMKEWRQLELDVLITPVMPCTAILPNTEILVYQLTFCCFQNIL